MAILFQEEMQRDGRTSGEAPPLLPAESDEHNRALLVLRYDYPIAEACSGQCD